MGKLVPALMATGGATAVSVGGVCLARNSGTGTDDQPESTSVGAGLPDSGSATITTSEPSATDQSAGVSPGSGVPSSPAAQSPVSTPNLEFETLENFKSNMKDSKCVSEYFGETIKSESGASEISSNSPKSNVFFKAVQTGTSDSYKSCLSINGKINSYADEDKWNGKFTWLWTFMRGDEGFINFNIAEPDDNEDEKVKFSGVFYLVGKKDGETNEWEVKHNKEVNSKVESANIGSYFPKAGDAIKDSVGGEYWGLFDDEAKLKKPCKTGDCGSGTTTTKSINKKLSFEKGDSPSQKPRDWSNSTDWWTNIYSIDGIWSLENKTDSFTGKWAASSQ